MDDEAAKARKTTYMLGGLPALLALLPAREQRGGDFDCPGCTPITGLRWGGACELCLGTARVFIGRGQDDELRILPATGPVWQTMPLGHR